jgi:hypothetical protein
MRAFGGAVAFLERDAVPYPSDLLPQKRKTDQNDAKMTVLRRLCDLGDTSVWDLRPSFACVH